MRGSRLIEIGKGERVTLSTFRNVAMITVERAPKGDAVCFVAPEIADVIRKHAEAP